VKNHLLGNIPFREQLCFGPSGFRTKTIPSRIWVPSFCSFISLLGSCVTTRRLVLPCHLAIVLAMSSEKGLKSGNIMLAEFQKRVAQSRNGKSSPKGRPTARFHSSLKGPAISGCSKKRKYGKRNVNLHVATLPCDF
jgi:hypothetical protein